MNLWKINKNNSQLFQQKGALPRRCCNKQHLHLKYLCRWPEQWTDAHLQ